MLDYKSVQENKAFKFQLSGGVDYVSNFWADRQRHCYVAGPQCVTRVWHQSPHVLPLQGQQATQLLTRTVLCHRIYRLLRSHYPGCRQSFDTCPVMSDLAAARSFSAIQICGN